MSTFIGNCLAVLICQLNLSGGLPFFCVPFTSTCRQLARHCSLLLLPNALAVCSLYDTLTAYFLKKNPYLHQQPPLNSSPDPNMSKQSCPKQCYFSGIAPRSGIDVDVVPRQGRSDVCFGFASIPISYNNLSKTGRQSNSEPIVQLAELRRLLKQDAMQAVQGYKPPLLCLIHYLSSLHSRSSGAIYCFSFHLFSLFLSVASLPSLFLFFRFLLIHLGVQICPFTASANGSKNSFNRCVSLNASLFILFLVLFRVRLKFNYPFLYLNLLFLQLVPFIACARPIPLLLVKRPCTLARIISASLSHPSILPQIARSIAWHTLCLPSAIYI